MNEYKNWEARREFSGAFCFTDTELWQYLMAVIGSDHRCSYWYKLVTQRVSLSPFIKGQG